MKSPWIWIALIAAAVLMLRPHGDTFTALDHSGYRLMAYAFSEGRGANDMDRMLLEIPEEARQECTLLPRTRERNTRDRSFLLHSDKTGKTEPFFYPVLSMGAASLQNLWPWGGMDLFVPLIGLAFVWALLAVGFRVGGGIGLCLAAALFLGTPLPAMLLRGFYAEVCGAALIALAALHWLAQPKGKPISLAAYAALGLAPAFHPILAVLSLPLLVALVATGQESKKRLLVGLTLFSVGVGLLLWVTARICAPYGSIRWENLLYNFRESQSHQVAYVFIFGFGLVLIGLLLWRLMNPSAFKRGLNGLHPGARSWLLAGLIPLVLALSMWRESPRVIMGLTELWSGIGWLFAALMLACVLILVISSAAGRARYIFGVSLVVLPVFAYLKGAEQMGMWSQRRLAPYILLMIPALLVPAAGWMYNRWRGNRVGMALAGVGVLLLGGSNFYRWPAPYWVQQEVGGLTQVIKLKEMMGDCLIFFDYLPDSFPFAVDGKTRVAGWSDRAKASKWGIIVQWLEKMAQTEEVWFVSSYSSSGMEEGIQFIPLFVENIELDRIHSKQALPAIQKTTERRLEFLRIEPAGQDPLHLHKIFDGGPLALRGNWGASRPMVFPDGRRVQGQWSREGSGVVGPVPHKGGAIRVILTASSGQKKSQRLQIIPPWGEADAVWMEIASEMEEYIIHLDSPAKGMGRRSGVYQFFVEEPYDPAQDGYGGYASDLGILIHSVQMEEE